MSPPSLLVWLAMVGVLAFMLVVLPVLGLVYAQGERERAEEEVAPDG